MNCREFDNEIQRLLDQRADLEASPLICVHAAQCARCRDQLTFYIRLFGDEAVNDVAERQFERRVRVAKRVGTAIAATVAMLMVGWIFHIIESKSTNTVASPEVPSGQVVRQKSRQPNQGYSHSPGLASGNLAFSHAINHVNNSMKNSQSGSSAQSPKRIQPVLAGGKLNESNSRIVFPNLSKLSPTVYQYPSRIPDPLSNLEPVYNYTGKFRVIRPWKKGIDNAIQLFCDSISEDEAERSPAQPGDLGKLRQRPERFRTPA